MDSSSYLLEESEEQRPNYSIPRPTSALGSSHQETQTQEKTADVPGIRAGLCELLTRMKGKSEALEVTADLDALLAKLRREGEALEEKYSAPATAPSTLPILLTGHLEGSWVAGGHNKRHAPHVASVNDQEL